MTSSNGGVLFWLVAIKDVILLYFLTIFSFIELFFQKLIPPRMKSLKDDIILVTGSASGIGRTLCLELATSGAKIVCWDINKWDNDALVKELKNLGASAYGFNVDVSDKKNVRNAAEQVKENVGDVTMIINNAGIMPCHTFLAHNLKEITRAFDVNVLSHMWIVREFLPKMIERKSGHIVAISSAELKSRPSTSAGLIGARNLTVYSATKFAVTGFMEALQDELENYPEPLDIKLTTVFPSPCETSFSKNVVHTRFPWLVPAFTKPEYVASKIVEGIKRNQLNIYIPHSIVCFSFFLKSLPTKVFVAAKKLIGVYAEPRSTTN